MKRGVIFLVVLLAVGFVSAEYSFTNYSIDKSYGPSSNLRGWLNISFNAEPATSLFTDSEGNEITLLDLLKTNANVQYSCNVEGCNSDYSASLVSSVKQISMGVGSEKTIGFVVNGKIYSIDSVDFVAESNAGKSCYNQLEFDFGSDGEVEVGNSKSSTESCSFLKDYGCFSESESASEWIIGKFPNKHCQKISLSESAGFALGAGIAVNGDTRDFEMEIYTLDGESTGASCLITNATGTGEFSCDVDYLITNSEDYYVCIYSDDTGSAKIKGYSDENGCGFYGDGVQKEDASFKIFAEGKKFDSVGTLNVENTLANGNTIADEINDYLYDKYGGLDCSGGCVIPLKINSEVSQNVELKNLELRYSTSLGDVVNDKFYELEESPAKISSDVQKVYINDAGFKTPADYGEFTFVLNFKNATFISEKVQVEEVPMLGHLSPTKTASAFPTSFEISVESPVNLTSYKWEFGDNATETTKTNKITHVYKKTGTYSLKITAEDSAGRSSSKIFDVLVTSPKELISGRLTTMQNNLENLNNQFKAMDFFASNVLKSVLDFESVEEEFKQIQRDYNAASTEEDYNKIVESILTLEIPKSITTSKKAEDIAFYPLEDNIDLEVLKDAGGGNYDSELEKDYITAILVWEQKNLETTLSFNELSGIYDDYERPLVNIFKVNLKAKEGFGSDPFIILGKMGGLIFRENYLEEEGGDFWIISIERDDKTIEFSTTEDIEFVDLPLFVSPALSRLELIEEPSKTEEDVRWGWIIIVITMILLLSFGVYIFLQEWYKSKYESYLFSNRNDLYNLIVYIKGAKEKGINENKIKAKLKRQGWSSEQINYVVRKYLGKRTGMIEIPVMKLIDKIRKILPSKKAPVSDQRRPMWYKGINSSRKI